MNFDTYLFLCIRMLEFKNSLIYRYIFLYINCGKMNSYLYGYNFFFFTYLLLMGNG